ncbi:hypothetical protein SEUCBS139899_009089 [Sporothrix eucalyptigena]|uniref:CENP-V/GFA domain-containing protein n=1 Tax=Sporothrix eucalyptigena TaxID=1812306 RepID=A0ABP0CKL3_9PEZI
MAAPSAASSAAADPVATARMTMDGNMIFHPDVRLPLPVLQPGDVRCQCGAIHFRVPSPTPLGVYHCHCPECRRQSSSAYGTSAVYPVRGLFPLDPVLRSKLSVYIRPGARSRTGRDMACYFCTVCGARVLHRYLKRRGGTTAAVRPRPDDRTGCGGGGDLGGDGAEGTEATETTIKSTLGEVDLEDEASYDGTTLTIKGGLIAGLDYSQAVHIYTEQAVVDIPPGVEQYPGTPPESR